MAAIHYSGGLRSRSGRSGVRVALPGWPVCCSGLRAEEIAYRGDQTNDRSVVTCRACLRLIGKELSPRSTTEGE